MVIYNGNSYIYNGSIDVLLVFDMEEMGNSSP